MSNTVVAVVKENIGSLSAHYDTAAKDVQSLKHIFKIEKERGNGYFLQASVYISDQDKLGAINKYLLVRYHSRHNGTIDIWYFDKKGLANRYVKAVDDAGVGDEAFEALDKHMICQYSQTSEGNGSFDWNK